jgi:hypothetical protein
MRNLTICLSRREAAHIEPHIRMFDAGLGNSSLDRIG